LKAHACNDDESCSIGSATTRAARGNRMLYVAAASFDLFRSSYAFYDFAGTARAHRGFPQPYAVWAHGWEVWGQPRPEYLRAIDRADLVLVNSDYTRERAGRFLPKGRVITCPLASWDDRAQPRVEADGPPTVLLLGRVDELFAKGHDLLIDVWPRIVASIPDARLVFVGGGTHLDKLRQLVSRSTVSSSITVTGFVPDHEIDGYWKTATVFAMLGFAEGFGLVYADAMQRGIPVIAATDDAGSETNIDGVTGFNVPRSNLNLLGDRILTLLSERHTARLMGIAGRRRWEASFTPSEFNKRFAAATRSLFCAR
jgi:phosphatidylinositol alpha-1,6-mannosyltransferase